MIYDFLKLSFEELVEKYPQADCVDRARKAVAFTEGNTLDTFSDNSDVLLYYDCLKPDRPLMVVERLTDEEAVSAEALESFIDGLNIMYDDYVFYYNVLTDKEYVDVTAVRRNVYDVLDHENG
jgi:hypothetical protein